VTPSDQPPPPPTVESPVEHVQVVDGPPACGLIADSPFGLAGIVNAPIAPALPLAPWDPGAATSVVRRIVTDVELVANTAMLDGDALVPGAASSSRSSMSTAAPPAFNWSAKAGAEPLTLAFVPSTYAHGPALPGAPTVPHVRPPKRLTAVVTVI
jgi:hypothetical protein